jgi:hypothetical protein
MSRKAKLGLWATIAAVLVIAMLWIGRLFDAAQALEEYLRPTTVEMMPLPEGCIQTNEAPPPDLMRIVENQENIYHLTLQKVVVCRSTHRFPAFERRLAGLSLGEGDRWRPLPRGCCSCRFRRHVIMEVADFSENGSVLVDAALIQRRWDYLQLKWNKTRGSWFWLWCLTGTLILAYALRRIVRR